MAVEIISFVLAILLLMFANYTEKNKGARNITKGILILIVLLVLLGGVASVEFPELMSSSGINAINYGYGTIITAFISFLIFIKAVRIWISKLIPIDPENWLHGTALVFAILLVGISLTTAISVNVVEFSKSSGIDSSGVIMQDVLFVLVSIFGVGWLTRRKLKDSLERLGIVKPSMKDIGWAVVYTAMLFLIVMIVGLISLMFNPSSAILDAEGDPTVEILGTITIATALLFALGAGVGEEILFRGAMQPRFGIIFTSIIFAAMHIQYLDFVSMGTLFLISVVLGYERKMVNTTAAIITHFLYDLVLLLMVAL